MRIRALLVAVCIATAGAATAETVRKSFRSVQKFPLSAGGLFVIENPVGDVTVQGGDGSEAVATITKVIVGRDEAAVDEGGRQTTVIVGGDERTRIVRSSVPPPGRGDWTGSVSWHVQLPRSASVRVVSQASKRITVTGLQGHVQVKNFTGNVFLYANTGPVVAESVNGSMLYNNARPRANVLMTSVNGNVTAVVAPDADVRWVAETIKGDVRTNLPARGTFIGPAFRASLNAPGGPTITTSTLMGTVQLLGHGVPIDGIRSLRGLSTTRSPALVSPAAGNPPRGTMRQLVSSSYKYETNLGDVRVQEIRGDADIFTGAGEVQLGLVTGSCKVQSLGGPLQIGEVLGKLSASTRAGDILVDSARRGGVIRTKGGTIDLLYTSGETFLDSDGGDIRVRQAAAPVDASTKSGDITIQVDPSSNTEAVQATTLRGNIVLNVKPQFAADIDATIVTDDPEQDTFLSQIPGLSISREQVRGRTRIRATGKINGGGERVVLRATGGDIRISTRPMTPTVVTRR